ncbi:MAG: tetratricopeptide repeat protein [Desulfatirhabdiaceae bacterium]
MRRSEILSTAFKTILFVLAGVPFLITGCAGFPSGSSPRTQQAPKAVPPHSQPEAPKKTDSRTIASLRLTDQAQKLIASNQPDQAIRIIEQAIAIDPTNGQNYYFLAEAWLMKGDRNQAMSFNRLAEIYLETDAAWVLKVTRQKEKIIK